MRSKIRGRRKRHFSIKKLCPLTDIADSKMGFLGLFKNGGVYLFYKLLVHSAAVVRNYDFKMASWIFCGHRSCRNSLWQCRFLPGRFNRFSRQWASLKKHRNFFCACVIFYILQRFLHNPVNIQKLVGIQARKINIVFRNQTELKRFAENLLCKNIHQRKQIVFCNARRSQVVAKISDVLDILILRFNNFSRRVFIRNILCKKRNIPQILRNAIVKLTADSFPLSFLNQNRMFQKDLRTVKHFIFFKPFFYAQNDKNRSANQNRKCKINEEYVQFLVRFFKRCVFVLKKTHKNLVHFVNGKQNLFFMIFFFQYERLQALCKGNA